MKSKHPDQKFIDATISALYHASDNQPSDYCEDSEFGNELIEWLHKEFERISKSPKRN